MSMLIGPELGARVAAAADEAERSALIADAAVDRPWLRLTGFGLAFAALFLLVSAAFGGLVYLAPAEIKTGFDATGALPDTPDRLIQEAWFAVGLGLALGALAAAMLVAAMWVYRRPARDFLWPGRRFDAGHFGVGLGMMAAAYVVMVPVYMLMEGEPWTPPLFDPTYLPDTRPTYVIGAVVGLLMAAAAEEVACRGVLLRIQAGFMRRAWLLCLVNGLVFAALHFEFEPVGFVARTLSGAVWAWAALRLGGLEFAIGAHLGNNLMITLFSSPMSEPSPSDPSWVLLAPELAVAGLTLVFVERLARRPPSPHAIRT